MLDLRSSCIVTSEFPPRYAKTTLLLHGSFSFGVREQWTLSGVNRRPSERHELLEFATGYGVPHSVQPPPNCQPLSTIPMSRFEKEPTGTRGQARGDSLRKPLRRGQL